jgi:hypothetical protein
MRCIIAGSRTITEYAEVERAVENSGFVISGVVSGGASGVDSLGERWAEEHMVPFEVYPAEWGLYGRSAGYRRNVQMADAADALIAVWNGGSRGTQHMIAIARGKGLKVYVEETDDTR